ncbi:hypothetical protein GE061_003153 [Apolygus lucorum]|uniref:G-protein coupled receptors family 1 profile domain-containing protein n=1 Tax=Apolygus lucorum TaxID=248454 RepID=A0A8S9X338_APOLU|nr:hypothetical protein GE061_003153 [Apolygus lucorum]
MDGTDTTVLGDQLSPINETDYEYDYLDSVNNFNWNELIPTTIVYAITLILGISGNLLIIITISKYRRMKSITNTFLASLASADLLLVLVCTPVKFYFYNTLCEMMKEDLLGGIIGFFQVNW